MNNGCSSCVCVCARMGSDVLPFGKKYAPPCYNVCGIVDVLVPVLGSDEMIE
jgi:hypothetical protein